MVDLLKPLMAKLLKPKGAGHDPYTDRVRKDWAAVIKMHPDNFDALLHKAIPTQASDTEDGANFGNLNERVEDIKYAEPILVSAVESNSDDDAFITSFDGDESMGSGDSSTIILRISEFEVPEGSAIEFLVSLAGGEVQRQWWYVHHSAAIGSPAIGVIHYCIPFGDIEQMTVPELPDLPSEPKPEPEPEPEPVQDAEPPATSAPSGALFSME